VNLVIGSTIARRRGIILQASSAGFVATLVTLLETVVIAPEAPTGEAAATATVTATAQMISLTKNMRFVSLLIEKSLANWKHSLS
jgi:hypothetical protein